MWHGAWLEVQDGATWEILNKELSIYLYREGLLESIPKGMFTEWAVYPEGAVSVVTLLDTNRHRVN